MPEDIEQTDVWIENSIYEIRQQRVMLDFDLARLFNIETRVLNQSVKRNLQRFPSDFMFRLSSEELAELRNSSQFVMSSKKQRGTKYRPFAFTEHGVVMLATVLRSPVAIEASIRVVRAFIRFRTILIEHRDLAQEVEQLKNSVESESKDQNKTIAALFEAIRSLIEQPPKTKGRIGFLKQSTFDQDE